MRWVVSAHGGPRLVPDEPPVPAEEVSSVTGAVTSSGRALPRSGSTSAAEISPRAWVSPARRRRRSFTAGLREKRF